MGRPKMKFFVVTNALEFETEKEAANYLVENKGNYSLVKGSLLEFEVHREPTVTIGTTKLTTKQTPTGSVSTIGEVVPKRGRPKKKKESMFDDEDELDSLE